MEAKKEERSEYVTLWVTPEVAKELKTAKDNDALKEKIIKDFFTRETDWLKEDMKEMDEATIRYTAKLLTIRDKFAEAQNKYSDEIGILCDITFHAFKPVEEKANLLKTQIINTRDIVRVISESVNELSEKVRYIDFSGLEKLMNAVDRFNKMTDTEKELIKSLLNTPK